MPHSTEILVILHVVGVPSLHILVKEYLETSLMTEVRNRKIQCLATPFGSLHILVNEYLYTYIKKVTKYSTTYKS